MPNNSFWSPSLNWARQNGGKTIESDVDLAMPLCCKKLDRPCLPIDSHSGHGIFIWSKVVISRESSSSCAAASPTAGSRLFSVGGGFQIQSLCYQILWVTIYSETQGYLLDSSRLYSLFWALTVRTENSAMVPVSQLRWLTENVGFYTPERWA